MPPVWARFTRTRQGEDSCGIGGNREVERAVERPRITAEGEGNIPRCERELAWSPVKQAMREAAEEEEEEEEEEELQEDGKGAGLTFV
jgi:hypothetical protein